jgi:hypothetical protein
MQKVGVAPHIIERVLGHVVGGIAGVYQRYDHSSEKATALQRWADHVERLVSGQADDNVLLMRVNQG